VFLDPGDTKDDIVGGGSNIEADRFFVAGNAEGKGVVVGEMSTLRGTSVGEDKGDRRMFGKTGKLVARG
jgi:hypothetical protein